MVGGGLPGSFKGKFPALRVLVGGTRRLARYEEPYRAGHEATEMQLVTIHMWPKLVPFCAFLHFPGGV
jgi:hypothetical protein